MKLPDIFLFKIWFLNKYILFACLSREDFETKSGAKEEFKYHYISKWGWGLSKITDTGK